MRIHPLLLTIGSAMLLAVAAWSEEGDSAPAPAPKVESEASRTYDALFSEMLQNLPEKSRAKVDSARVNAKAVPRDLPEAVLPAPDEGRMSEKRGQAMERLPADVKLRVEKTIESIENRKKDRQLEFKELEK